MRRVRTSGATSWGWGSTGRRGQENVEPLGASPPGNVKPPGNVEHQLDGRSCPRCLGRAGARPSRDLAVPAVKRCVLSHARPWLGGSALAGNVEPPGNV